MHLGKDNLSSFEQLIMFNTLIDAWRIMMLDEIEKCSQEVSDTFIIIRFGVNGRGTLITQLHTQE